MDDVDAVAYHLARAHNQHCRLTPFGYVCWRDRLVFWRREPPADPDVIAYPVRGRPVTQAQVRRWLDARSPAQEPPAGPP